MPALASNCCRVLPDCRDRKPTGRYPDPAAGAAPAAFATPETVFGGAAEPVFRAVEELFSAFIDIDREGREEFLVRQEKHLLSVMMDIRKKR